MYLLWVDELGVEWITASEPRRREIENLLRERGILVEVTPDGHLWVRIPHHIQDTE